MRRLIFILLLLLINGFVFWACESSSSDPITDIDPDPEPEQIATYKTIQAQVFDKYCISCHTAGNTFAIQSDLVLTEDVSYSQLVGRMPKNTAARNDGLKLVGTDGLASIHKSFLWEKINARNTEHFNSEHPFYGAIMPIGSSAITDGEFKLIEEWIKAGAPETGAVVENVETILADTTRYRQADFEALTPPTEGMQFHVGPFDVEPGGDLEFYMFEPLYNNEDIFVNRVEIRMRPGSHHFIAYRYDDSTPQAFLDYLTASQIGNIRDIRLSNGDYDYTVLISQLYLEFVAGTQWPLMNYNFPPGVALRIPANSYFDLNSHYVNRSAETFTGEVYANMHTIEASEVVKVANILNLNNSNFSLPPNQETTLVKEYTFNNRRHIFQLFSHAHKQMTEFKVFVKGGARDGELVYISYDWEHPPILELDPPLTLEAGEGLRLETTYNNTTSNTLTFGFGADDEMMILFGAYYTD